MADEKHSVNGHPEAAAPEAEQAPEFGNKPTPEGAMVDLTGTAEETLLLPQSAKIPYFFAFDALLDQAIVARYVKGLIPAKIACAPNYRLVWPYFYPPADSALPSLQRSAGSRVWGQLFDARGVKFDKLDEHMSVPNRYHRRAVQVLDRGDRRFSAFTYVLTISDPEPRKPSEAYLRHLIDNARNRGLPDEWIAELEKMG